MNAVRTRCLGSRHGFAASLLTLLLVGWQFNAVRQPGLAAVVQTDTPQRMEGKSEQEKPLAESELVEGLLELMEDQEPKQGTQQDPLVPVQRMMLEVSELLQGKQAIQQAAKLQQSILSQLDSLISQLQGGPPSPTPNDDPLSMNRPDQELAQRPNSGLDPARLDGEERDNGGQQPGGTSPSDTPQSTDSQSLSEKLSMDGNSEKAGTTAAASPGGSRSGVSAPAAGQLDTPLELQQSVWGHLPEKLRSQMQSRMVEQFLPSYRKQLESYYRTLLMQESER